MSYLSISVIEKRSDAKLKELSEIGSLIQGSFSTVKTTCGKSNCKCAKGEKHISNILTKKVNGKTKTTYIPKDMVENVKLWLSNNKKLKKLQKEISDYNQMILKKYVKNQRQKKKNIQMANQVVSQQKNL